MIREFLDDARGRRALSAPAIAEQIEQRADFVVRLGRVPDDKRGGHRIGDDLADRLGDDHDLAVLSQRRRAPKKLRKLIAVRRKKLQKRALRLGEKLYRKKPRRVAARLS